MRPARASTRRRRGMAALARAIVGVSLTGLLASAALADSVRPVYAPPAAYYLALGDSVAYGIQPAKVSAGLPPSGFRTGYVDVFAARMRILRPHLRIVNYSCPAESTTTFVYGGCPWLASGRHRLHDAFPDTQMAAALAFLRAHRGRVSPITVSLGGNDVEAFSEACHNSVACARARAPRAIREFSSRLAAILARLRAAAPGAEIVVTGLWNNDIETPRQTDPLVRAVNNAIAGIATSAKSRLADLFPVFNPQGNLTRKRARICALTFLCSQGDGHPTDAGYRAIAAAVWAASGYKA
jgi:lysophospholipase L1-like esterase